MSFRNGGNLPFCCRFWKFHEYTMDTHTILSLHKCKGRAGLGSLLIYSCETTSSLMVDVCNMRAPPSSQNVSSLPS